MVGVLTMFGEVDLQDVLKKMFLNNDLVFIAENCITSVQLIDKLNEHYKESDVVIISASAMNMDAFGNLVGEIRSLEAKMRIILVLNGNRQQYTESQYTAYEKARIDVLFDDNGFEIQDLIDLVKKGRLPKLKSKEIKEIRRPLMSDIETDSAVKDKDIIKIDSYDKPKGKFTIGILNVSRGCGATSVAISMAQYFTLHDYSVKILDLSGTGALELAKMRDIETGDGIELLEDFRNNSNIIMIDFGTPYDISAKGDSFKISEGYNHDCIKEINRCDIKIIMGYSNSWNIGRVKCLLSNEGWKSIIDDSYIVLVSGRIKTLKSEYPRLNIMGRDDEYKEDILKILREAE